MYVLCVVLLPESTPFAKAPLKWAVVAFKQSIMAVMEFKWIFPWIMVGVFA